MNRGSVVGAGGEELTLEAMEAVSGGSVAVNTAGTESTFRAGTVAVTAAVVSSGSVAVSSAGTESTLRIGW